MPTRWRRPISLLWLCCWVVILYAGLWPLDFHPVNAVLWLTKETGLRFTQKGLAYWPQGLAGILRELDPRSDNFTVELLLRPSKQDKPHEGILLESASRNGRSRLVLEQYGTLLILMESRGSGRDLVRRKAGVFNALPPGELAHVTLTGDENEKKLYLNGVPAEKLLNVVDARQLDGPLVLGNSAGTGDPWEGDVRYIAFHAGLRTPDQIAADARRSDPGLEPPEGVYYDFTESPGNVSYGRSKKQIPIYIPAKLPLLKRTLLSWDLHTDWSGISDVLINIFGFIPFGFLGAAALSLSTSLKRSMFYTLAIGFLLSLLIEVTQSYLPFRTSSSVDLLMNTLGTVAGIVLFASILGYAFGRQVKTAPAA